MCAFGSKYIVLDYGMNTWEGPGGSWGDISIEVYRGDDLKAASAKCLQVDGILLDRYTQRVRTVGIEWMPYAGIMAALLDHNVASVMEVEV